MSGQDTSLASRQICQPQAPLVMFLNHLTYLDGGSLDNVQRLTFGVRSERLALPFVIAVGNEYEFEDDWGSDNDWAEANFLCRRTLNVDSPHHYLVKAEVVFSTHG
jgi:hypothetical protein